MKSTPGSLMNILVLGLIVWGVFSLFQSDTYQPVYYPDYTNLTEYTYGPIVNSLEQCRDWIDSEAVRRNQTGNEFDYECGKNCKYDPDWGLEVCEETLE